RLLLYVVSLIISVLALCIFFFFLLMLRLPLRSTLFPYTTLFRSVVGRNQGGRGRSRPQFVERARKRDCFPDVRDATDPRHRALHAEPEPRMDERPVFPEIEIPAVGIFR